jgi:hypothetical protein
LIAFRVTQDSVGAPSVEMDRTDQHLDASVAPQRQDQTRISDTALRRLAGRGMLEIGGSATLDASYGHLNRKKALGSPFIITKTCPGAYRAYWQLNANQLSSGNDAESLDSGT